MEIERKWLIDPNRLPFPREGAEVWNVEQAYLAFSPCIRIRSVNDEHFFLTVKILPGTANGSLISREEYEFPIPRETYEDLRSKSAGTVLSKTRYRVPLGNGLTAETDIFHGELEGLAYLELEFPDEESAVSYPDPAGTLCDVSNDPAFTNGALARNGFPEAAGAMLHNR